MKLVLRHGANRIPRMTRQEGRRGFTLVEAMLAITVTMLVFSSMLVGYHFAKESAATSHARERVQSLRVMVENAVSANNEQPPSLDTVATIWKKRRTDWRASPWGGGLGPNAQLQDCGILTQTVGDGAKLTANSDSNPDLAGGMAYFLAPQMSSTFQIQDLSVGGAFVTVRGYGIAHLGKDGSFYHFVAGGATP